MMAEDRCEDLDLLLSDDAENEEENGTNCVMHSML